MSKYNALMHYLQNLSTAEWNASFEEIENILGFKLPASAYEYQAWWANQSGGGHTQSAAWQDAGWKTEDLNLTDQTVKFVYRPAYNAFAELAQRKPSVSNAFAPSTAPNPAPTNAFADYRPAKSLREHGPEFADNETGVAPLTIAQAKAGLATYFGVPVSNIEITIRG